MLKKTGTLLHTSAAVHAAKLATCLDKYEVDASAMSNFLPPKRKLVPTNVVHTEARSTDVVRMNVDDGLIKGIERELNLRTQIDAAIMGLAAEEIAGTKGIPGQKEAQQYSPLSTQFENSIFFLPSAQRFYNMNRELVLEHFPEVETTVVNAFVVAPGREAYGVHNAGSIGFQMPPLTKRGHGYPHHQVSFHTAITPTPLERQPFVLFNDATSESPNTSHSYSFVREHDLDPEEAATLDKAFYLHDAGKLSELDLPAIQHFLLCKYWEKKYAADPERASGYYNECAPGDALVFDNYLPHGDSTLPPASEPRITMDLRCFSKVTYPSPSITSGIDLLLGPDRKKIQEKRKRQTLGCLLMLLGYENLGEFLLQTYGTEEIDSFDMTTDLQFSAYNKTEHYVLDQNLDAHYERVQEVYDRIEKEGGYEVPRRAREAMLALYTTTAPA